MQALRRTVRTLLLPGLLVSGIAASAGDEHSFTNWTQYLGGSDSAQYSSLKQINKANVKQLELAWSYPTGTGTFIFEPIVVDGVMYVLKAGTPPPNAPPAQPGGRGPQAGTAIAALDAATGKELWVHPNMGAVGTRGMNYWESKDRSDRRLLSCNAGIPDRHRRPHRPRPSTASATTAAPICAPGSTAIPPVRFRPATPDASSTT